MLRLTIAESHQKLVDEREYNYGDIIKIVLLETALILGLLVVLTRRLKMPIYMMGTILLSYVSALGLGVFLIDVLFGYDAISTRVPVYAFIFLVALGIDYNIILASRFIEELKNHKVKDALEIAIRNTGGVISSAGIILAATFAASDDDADCRSVHLRIHGSDWDPDRHIPCSRHAASCIDSFLRKRQANQSGDSIRNREGLLSHSLFRRLKNENYGC